MMSKLMGNFVREIVELLCPHIPSNPTPLLPPHLPPHLPAP